MNSKQTSVIAPKKALVIHITKNFSKEEIRSYFRFGSKADIEKTLAGKSKPEIVAFLLDTTKGRGLLKELEDLYSIERPPTFYLANLHQSPDYKKLVGITHRLAFQGREHGLLLKDDARIRVVYASREAQRLSYYPQAIELPIFYEERVEYSESDPSALDFGERKFLYSLEQGFIWILEGHTHAVICCQGFAPVKPILEYARSYLGFDWALPNLTFEMMQKITWKRKPRSATFSILEGDLETRQQKGKETPVRTVTLSDPELNDCDDFQTISHDPNRQQTAGFYSETPRFTFGGMGIARRYARVWTPARTSNRNYLALATELIEQTESELSHTYKTNLAGYVNFYQDYPVIIEKHRIHGRERDAFNRLTLHILEAHKHKKEIPVDTEFLEDLISLQRPLHLITCATLDCPNCGNETLIVCPACRRPLLAGFHDKKLVLKCPNKKCQTIISEEDEVECQCRQRIGSIMFINHIQIYPKSELLDALWSFIDKMQDVNWHGVFAICGGILNAKALSPEPVDKVITLSDLKSWRVKAHFNRSYMVDGKKDKYIHILNKVREKCKDTGYHPYKSDCEECLKSKMTEKHLQEGRICLPRIFGLPIDLEDKFDGIHCGSEHADIKYKDIITKTGKEARLGIHLKSRTVSAKKSLGHGAESIRGLYTQLIHSAYEASTRKVKFNILGVSVPNEINEEVRTSLKRTANLWGFPILILEENDWVRIVDEAEKKLHFEK